AGQPVRADERGRPGRRRTCRRRRSPPHGGTQGRPARDPCGDGASTRRTPPASRMNTGAVTVVPTRPNGSFGVGWSRARRMVGAVASDELSMFDTARAEPVALVGQLALVEDESVSRRRLRPAHLPSREWAALLAHAPTVAKYRDPEKLCRRGD